MLQPDLERQTTLGYRLNGRSRLRAAPPFIFRVGQLLPKRPRTVASPTSRKSGSCARQAEGDEHRSYQLALASQLGAAAWGSDAPEKIQGHRGKRSVRGRVGLSVAETLTHPLSRLGRTTNPRGPAYSGGHGVVPGHEDSEPGQAGTAAPTTTCQLLPARPGSSDRRVRGRVSCRGRHRRTGGSGAPSSSRRRRHASSPGR